MKTTIDIPDVIYPAIVAASAARGESVEEYVVRVTSETAEQLPPLAVHPGSSEHPIAPSAEAIKPRIDPDFQRWWDSIPKAPAEEARAVQQIFDEEFSRVDPRDWE